MTGREYLDLFPAGTNGFKTDNWQQLFHIPLDDITENYSTGMGKKLALLAVLKQDKPIVVLDEPFNGLDLESAHISPSSCNNSGKGAKQCWSPHMFSKH